MRKFTEVLEEYLEIRDQLNSDYFDDRYIGERVLARTELKKLADELDVMFSQVKDLKWAQYGR